MSTKKPVVVESYDEIVFTEPSESFLARVRNHPAVTFPRLPAGVTLPPPGLFLCLLFEIFCLVLKLMFHEDTSKLLAVSTEDESKKKRGDTKDHPLSQWFLNFSEADELLQLAAARQQVSKHDFYFLG